MKIPEKSLIYIYHFYSLLTYPPPSDPAKQSEIVFGFHVLLCNYLRFIHLIKNCVSKFSPRKRWNDSHSRPNHRSLQRHAERCLLPHPATATATNADAFPLSLHRAEGKTIRNLRETTTGMPTPRGVTPPLPSNPYEVRERMDSSARRCWWRCEGCPRPSKGMPLLLSQKTWRSSSCRPVGRFVQSVVEMRSRRTCYFSWEFALSTKKIQRIVLFVFSKSVLW